MRITRCSLALSLAVKFGLGTWVVLALLGGPSGSSAALTPPSKQGLEAQSSVELAQSRQKKRRAQAPQSRIEPEHDEPAAQTQHVPEPARRQQDAPDPGKECTYCNRCLLNDLENPLGCYELSRFDGDYDAMIRQVMSVYRPPPFA